MGSRESFIQLDRIERALILILVDTFATHFSTPSLEKPQMVEFINITFSIIFSRKTPGIPVPGGPALHLEGGSALPRPPRPWPRAASAGSAGAPRRAGPCRWRSCWARNWRQKLGVSGDDRGVSIVMGVSPKKWLVGLLKGKCQRKIGMIWGVSHFRKPPYI